MDEMHPTLSFPSPTLSFPRRRESDMPEITDSRKAVIPAPFVIPAQAGIQFISNQLKTLGSSFHGNDRKLTFETFCEFVKISVWVFLMVMLFSTLETYAAAAEIYCFQDNGGVSYYTNVPGPGHTKVRLPMVGEKRHQATGNRATSVRPKEVYETVITSASRHFAIDPDVIRAVIKAESNYNERAVSPQGALGLMQLMPATAREMGVGDVFDPVQNIHGGAKYLSELLGALNGDLSLALAAYNAGPARVFGQNKIPPIRETRYYVERVLNLYRGFKGRNTL